WRRAAVEPVGDDAHASWRDCDRRGLVSLELQSDVDDAAADGLALRRHLSANRVVRLATAASAFVAGLHVQLRAGFLPAAGSRADVGFVDRWLGAAAACLDDAAVAHRLEFWRALLCKPPVVALHLAASVVEPRSAICRFLLRQRTGGRGN